MIIEWQMTQNALAMKIDQLVFICNFVKDKSMQDYNPVSISIKANNWIEI